MRRQPSPAQVEIQWEACCCLPGLRASEISARPATSGEAQPAEKPPEAEPCQPQDLDLPAQLFGAEQEPEDATVPDSGVRFTD